MLFVLVMEVLNSLIKEANRQGALSPLPGQVVVHRASLYADDLVVLLSPRNNDLLCLVQIPELFAGASGLVTNMEKCVAMPIRCNENTITGVQQVFLCVVSPFPCKYLGIPPSLRWLGRVDEQPLIDAIAARIPTWKVGLLTNAGQVILTKVTLSAIPVHLSTACCLSSWAIKQIDKRRRAFLWTGTDSCSGGSAGWLGWWSAGRPTSEDWASSTFVSSGSL
jgi:hypothetical protein